MTIKTLEELNLEFNSAEFSGTPTEGKKRSLLAIISGTLFFLAIVLVLFSVLTASKYSFFTVLSSSMQPEIPKGALILVYQTDPQKLEPGDNITFMRDWKTSVTHKIVDIYENYQNSGARGFRMKGVSNLNPDKEIVPEENIVGKVIFILPSVGEVISRLVENIYIIYIVFGAGITLFITIRIKNNKPERNE